MPPLRKFSKDDIINITYKIVKEEGLFREKSLSRYGAFIY